MIQTNILFFIFSIKCSQILSLFEFIDQESAVVKFLTYTLLFSIGLFISVYGIKYKITSVTILFMIFFDMFFTSIYTKIKSVIENKEKLMFLDYENYVSLKDFIDNRKMQLFIIMFVIGFLLSVLLVCILKFVSTVSGIMILVYISNEVFSKNSLFSVPITNTFLQAFVVAISAVIIYYAFQRAPNIILAVFFGIIGPLFVTVVIELTFGFDWGFKKAFDELTSGNTITSQPNHLIFILFICAIVVTWQVYYATTKK